MHSPTSLWPRGAARAPGRAVTKCVKSSSPSGATAPPRRAAVRASAARVPASMHLENSTRTCLRGAPVRAPHVKAGAQALHASSSRNGKQQLTCCSAMPRGTPR